MTDHDSETVYVSPGAANRIYHSDPECTWIRGDVRDRDREMMDAWDYRLCKACADGIDVCKSGGGGGISNLERILNDRDDGEEES